MTDELHKYMLSVSSPFPEVIARQSEETSKLASAGMQSSPEQGKLLTLLIKLLGAKKTLEVGVFTGYSALIVALAMPEDGKIIACDVSEEWTSIGRKYWEEAGIAHKIDLRLAPGNETLDALLTDGQAGTFDFAFIDADKSGYDGYYERCLQLLRPGGLIGIDNTLWHGKVADESVQDADTIAIRTLNKKLAGDTRVELSMVPIGDGLTLALKR